MKYFLSFFLMVQFVFSQSKMKPEETEFWEPEPQLVQPGIYNSPPSDAIVLFNGSDFSKWRNEKTQGAVEWTLNSDKTMTVKPGTGSIETIEEHGSIQLHIEWKSPIDNKGEGQLRGNSGIIFQRRYEVQVLNSYQNRTYSNGQAGSIYLQHIPLVNAMDFWVTLSLSSPKERFPMIGFFGLVLISTTGAKLICTPNLLLCSPILRPTFSIILLSEIAPRVMFHG